MPLPQADDHQITLRQQTVDQKTDVMRARVSRRKGERKLKILSEKGRIRPGTEIVMTRGLSDFQPDPADKRFQAHFTEDIKVVWEQDGKVYSLNKLNLKILEEETQKPQKSKQCTIYWSLAEDRDKTLSQLADEIAEE